MLPPHTEDVHLQGHSSIIDFPPGQLNHRSGKESVLSPRPASPSVCYDHPALYPADRHSSSGRAESKTPATRRGVCEGDRGIRDWYGRVGICSCWRASDIQLKSGNHCQNLGLRDIVRGVGAKFSAKKRRCGLRRCKSAGRGGPCSSTVAPGLLDGERMRAM